MHLLMKAMDLVGSETMTFKVWAYLHNADKTAVWPIEIESFELTATANEKHFTFDVSDHEFRFTVDGPIGRFACLSYYLTV